MLPASWEVMGEMVASPWKAMHLGANWICSPFPALHMSTEAQEVAEALVFTLVSLSPAGV